MAIAEAPHDTLLLPKLHAGQIAVRRESRRFNVLACGRRWGKNVFGESRVVVTTLKHAAPVGWFAPTYKQLLPTWRELVDRLSPVTAKKNEQEHRIQTVNGGVLECWSLDEPDAARGRKYKRVIIDEAAHIRDLERAWQGVIRPTLLDYTGDAWFNSTPNGLNFFHDLYRRGQDPLYDEWVSWRRPSSENPHISAEEIAAARAESPERYFAKEYLAEFLEDTGAVFRKVKDAAGPCLLDNPVPGRSYVMGVDLARRVDFSVLTVMDTQSLEVVAMDRFNQVDWGTQINRIQILAEKFRVVGLVVDETGVGDPVLAGIRNTMSVPVVGYHFSSASKTALIESLALAFERERITIPGPETPIGAVLAGELLSYAIERLPSGTLRYSAPDGKHDDTVVSLALAYWAAHRPTGDEPPLSYGFDLSEDSDEVDDLAEELGFSNQRLFAGASRMGR